MVNDLFFGAPISETVSKKLKGAKEVAASFWKKHFKGVTPGGEEFTAKLDKLIPKGSKRPNFHHGTMKEVIEKITSNKPFLLYLSGDDAVSKKFEKEVLTKDGIIMIMVINLVI